MIEKTFAPSGADFFRWNKIPYEESLASLKGTVSYKITLGVTMPYIKQEDRDALDNSGRFPETPGELNYLITKLCKEFLPQNPNYDDYNTIIGVLECAKLEFYRRQVAEYENKKMEENGDVYGGL